MSIQIRSYRQLDVLVYPFQVLLAIRLTGLSSSGLIGNYMCWSIQFRSYQQLYVQVYLIQVLTTVRHTGIFNSGLTDN